MKDVRIVPSRPSTLPRGSRKSVMYLKRLSPPTLRLAIIHITAPAGKATTTARVKTDNTLVFIERIIVLNICGFLYLGNSKINEEDFSAVTDEIIFEVNSVIAVAIISSSRIINAVKMCVKLPSTDAAKKMVLRVISVGMRPLQGMKLFVSIAMLRSLLDDIIRHPTTPQALQPNPISIVRACFPLVPEFLNIPSRLNATLGR